MAVTSPIAKLVIGTDELNLQAAPFKVATDFIPPPLNQGANIASGTSANRVGGGTLVGTRALDRRWRFGVHIEGESEMEVRSATNLLQDFLSRAGDPNDPLTLQWRGNSDIAEEPLWGQYGSNLRYEILQGIVTLSSQYAIADLRSRGLPNCRVDLTIKPYALGVRQLLTSAKGGIQEDLIGSIDGRSKGTVIMSGSQNQITNPIFGNATYDLGWTTGSDLISTENKNGKFIIAGVSSVKLTRTGNTNILFTQSINAGDTNPHRISAYVKRADGEAVTSADAVLHYNVDLTTAYQLIGDGWYRLTASATGIASAQPTGISIETVGRTIWADGFQFQDSSFHTPLIHGDLLGHTWAGTDHDSVSDMTDIAFKVNAAEVLDIAEGTIRVVYKPFQDDSHAINRMLFTNGGSSFEAVFAFGDQLNFTDGTNNFTIGSVAFNAGDIIVFHFVWGTSGLKIYRNGVVEDTDPTYTPPTLAADLFIGQDTSAGTHCNGTIMDFSTYARELTAAEILADFNNIDKQIENDRRLSPIPWLWTKDGDDILDNHDDDNQDNFMIIGGVPGSTEAITRWEITPDVTVIGWWLGKALTDYRSFVLPSTQFYADYQGTVTAATDSGGEVLTTSIGTSPVSAAAFDVADATLPLGRVHFFVRLSDTGSDLTIQGEFRFGTDGNAVTSDFIPITTDTTRRWYYAGSIFVEQPSTIPDDEKQGTFRIVAKRTTGGSTNVLFDFGMFIAGDVMRILNGANTSSIVRMIIEGPKIYTRTATGIIEVLNFAGEIIELTPEQLNFVFFMQARDGDAHTVADVATFNDVFVTPRWALL